MLAIDLPLEIVLYPLGFPLKIRTNSLEIIHAAKESWMTFAKLFPEPSLELRVIVNDDSAAYEYVVPTCRAQRSLWVNVAGRTNFALSDLAAGFGFCFLSSAVAAETAYVRYYFLEAVVYSMLAHLCITPLHAACVSRNGRGILLFGPAGAGKSCLSFACAKRGWTYISDDGSSLVRGREGSVVLGKPHRIRFRESAADLFPELEGLEAMTAGNGEAVIEIDMAEMPGIATSVSCVVERIAFLDRQTTGPAAVLPMKKETALQKMTSDLPIFEPTVHQAHKDSLRAVAELDAVLLQYSSLESAVQQLEILLRT